MAYQPNYPLRQAQQACLLAGIVLSLTLNVSVLATTSKKQSTSKERSNAFQLKASFTDGTNEGFGTYSSLSTAEGAPIPVTFERKFEMVVTPKGKAETAQLDIAKAENGSTEKTQGLKPISESSIDWSGWAAQLADRWYANLKNLEYNSHRGWTTKQPARIKFTCHADGRVTDIELRQSCGNPAFDQMQIDALKRSVPLPSFPAGTKLLTYTMLQGWEAHPRQPGEKDYQPGSFGANMPVEKVATKVKVAPKSKASAKKTAAKTAAK